MTIPAGDVFAELHGRQTRPESRLHYWLRDRGVVMRWYEFTRYGPWHGIRREAGAIAESIENLIDWFPVIWHDRDFDHRYLLTIMEHKLERMAKFHASPYAHTVRAPITARQLHLAAELVRRIGDEEYSYGFGIPDELDWRKARVDNARLQSCRSEQLRQKLAHRVEWKDRIGKTRSMVKRGIDHQQMMHQQDIDYLHRLFSKYLQSWWD